MLLQELRQPSEFVNIEPPECVKTRGLMNGKKVVLNAIYLSSYLGLTSKICIKPMSIDRIVSKYIRKFGAWEPKLVNSVLKMVQKFPEATFLGWTI